MSSEIESRLGRAPVVPLVQSDDPQIAIDTTKALVAGGLTVIEVVMRTPEALVCIEAIARSVPEAIVGAGTVLSEEHANAAVSAGAEFLVSPGLHAPVVEVAKSAGLMMYPGVSTATDDRALLLEHQIRSLQRVEPLLELTTLVRMQETRAVRVEDRQTR